MMSELTIFTTCKPFEGVNAVHQRNAICSWHGLGVPVLLIGDEPGVADLAAELGVAHVPHVARNPDGLPIVSDLFEIAEQQAKTRFLAYLNADIILLPGMVDALSVVAEKMASQPFLVTTRRFNVALNHALDFSDPQIGQTLCSLADVTGSWDYPYAIDLFLFSRGLFQDIPPFSIGRPMWDNWMLWYAGSQGVPVVDVSSARTALHPIHGYGGQWAEITHGSAAQHNRKLGPEEVSTIDSSSTHYLEDQRVARLADETAESHHSRFVPDNGRELVAYLHFAQGDQNTSAAQVMDDLRSLLWRWQRFFPVRDFTKVDAAAVKSLLVQASDLCGSGRWQEAIDLVQDFACRDFSRAISQSLENGLPLFVWGTGAYARRLYIFLERHGITLTGAIDSYHDPRHDPVFPVPVQKPGALAAQKERAPLILIGTMYFDQVLSQMAEYGLNDDDCLY